MQDLRCNYQYPQSSNSCLVRVEKNTFDRSFKKNKFSNKKFIKRSKFKKNFGYRQKSKKSNFDNNKTVRY